MSLRPKSRVGVPAWRPPTVKEREDAERASKTSRRKYLTKRGEYISQWTPEERRGGLNMLSTLAADAHAKRNIIRRGKKYELVEMFDTKEFAFADAREARRFDVYGQGSDVFVKSFGKDFLWGLYVHSKEGQ